MVQLSEVVHRREEGATTVDSTLVQAKREEVCNLQDRSEQDSYGPPCRRGRVLHSTSFVKSSAREERVRIHPNSLVRCENPGGAPWRNWNGGLWKTFDICQFEGHRLWAGKGAGLSLDYGMLCLSVNVCEVA